MTGSQKDSEFKLDSAREPLRPSKELGNCSFPKETWESAGLPTTAEAEQQVIFLRRMYEMKKLIFLEAAADGFGFVVDEWERRFNIENKNEEYWHDDELKFAFLPLESVKSETENGKIIYNLSQKIVRY